MGTLLKRVSVVAAILLFQGCTSVVVTTPLCGPDSVDHRPEVGVPEAAFGCYEAASVSGSYLSSANIFASRPLEFQYVLFARQGRRLSVSLSEVNSAVADRMRMMDTETALFCEVPQKNANPNARLLMDREHGWTTFMEWDFDVERGMLSFGTYSISAEQVKNSGLRYVVFPGISSAVQSTGTRTYPSSDIFSSGIEMTLIDNSQITPEQLFDRLKLRKNIGKFEFKRVDPSFCAQNKMHKVF